MSEDSRRADKDRVTVGQIRKRFEATLESQIDTLNKLIRKGYHDLPGAETYLKGAIADTLTKMQNIDAMASTEVLFPDSK